MISRAVSLRTIMIPERPSYYSCIVHYDTLHRPTNTYNDKTIVEEDLIKCNFNFNLKLLLLVVTQVKIIK